MERRPSLEDRQALGVAGSSPDYCKSRSRWCDYPDRHQVFPLSGDHRIQTLRRIDRYTLSAMSLKDVLSAIDAEIARVEQARALLTETGTGRRGMKPAAKPVKAKRTLSAAARKRIAAAQRKRWAAVRKAQE